MMGDLTYCLFGASLLISYCVRWRAYLGPLDPLQFMALSEAVWVVTVYKLAETGVASDDQISVFATCLFLWWASWWCATWLFGRSYRNWVTMLFKCFADMPLWRRQRLLLLYLFGLLILVVVTLSSGGGGDNRLAIIKLLKPMESITTILVPIVLFHLLISKGQHAKLILIFVIVGMIITGGKSSILSLLLPVTGATLIGRIRIRPRLIVGMAVIALIGFCASVMINYGVSDPLTALQYLYVRISLDGDVYLLSLPNDLLSQTKTTSLVVYLFGPAIKLLFLPINVDTNIGAQIGSLLSGEDTVNGPNPHWPIVLLAYKKSQTAAILLSLLCFASVLALKFGLSRLAANRKWPLWALIPVSGYVFLYPQTFFADPSFPLIYLLQAGVLAIFLMVALRPLRASPSRVLLGDMRPNAPSIPTSKAV